MLLDFFLICGATAPSLAEEELTWGLRAAFKMKKVTLWLVFAVQVYLNIYNILRDKVDGAFATLSSIASIARNSINKTFEFYKDLRIETWPKKSD